MLEGTGREKKKEEGKDRQGGNKRLFGDVGYRTGRSESRDVTQAGGEWAILCEPPAIGFFPLAATCTVALLCRERLCCLQLFLLLVFTYCRVLSLPSASRAE